MKLFVVAVCFCFGRAGERVSFGVVAVAVVAVVVVCFCFGGTGERVSFGGGVVVAVVCFCFGGRWRFGVGCETVRRRRHRLFLFRGDGGASQLWCRRRRRRLFLFRGTVAIWSWV